MKTRIFIRRLAQKHLDRGIWAEMGIAKGRCHDSAFQCYRRAAVLGNHQAQFFLAVQYASGLEGPKNNRMALAWFRRAAIAGESLCELTSRKKNATPAEQIQSFSKFLNSDAPSNDV